MRYLVTGANGQLGRELQRRLSLKKLEFMALDIEEMDITKQEEVLNIIGGYKPDVVIHGAAFTNVDGAESNAKAAFLVNAIGTQNVAAACLGCNAKMVYVSTDYVFDGKKESAYSEIDLPNPQSIYGQSKLMGENLARHILNKLYIMRTAWLYGDGPNFVRTMLKLGREKEELKVVDDQYGSPTSTKDLAEAILRIVQTESYGTYHAVNRGVVNWYGFAKEIFLRFGNEKIKVLPQSTTELNRPAPRPPFSHLDCTLLDLVVGSDAMRSWQDALADYIDLG